MKSALRMILLAMAACFVLGAAGGVWRDAAPGYRWSFPADLAAHPDYKTEWWYVTGHLDRPGGETLGFQVTFFRVGLLPPGKQTGRTAWDPRDLVMAHAALTDPDSGRHVFSEVIRRTTPFLGGFGSPGDSMLAWCAAPAGTPGKWTLVHADGVFRVRVRDNAQDLAFTLTCRPTRKPVFHGDGGFSPKTATGDVGSLYFSQTRMEVQGSVRIAGRGTPVTGSAWLDREIFSNTLGSDQKGWDWAALNLDSGEDLMLYRLRGKERHDDFALGTFVDSLGAAAPLPGNAWRLEPLRWWASPHTGARYPVAWKLTVPGRNLTFRLEAVLPDQENVSALTGIHYWEGAVTVAPWENPDRIIGRGFVELTGYGEGSRPPV